MNFQKTFNNFVRNGGTKMLLVYDGLTTIVMLDCDAAVESALFSFGDLKVESVKKENGILVIELSELDIKEKDKDWPLPDTKYRYIYNDNDFFIFEDEDDEIENSIFDNSEIVLWG